jgi:hypothetical protein
MGASAEPGSRKDCENDLTIPAKRAAIGARARRAGAFTLVLLVVVLAAGGSGGAGRLPVLHDEFESASLDPELWWPRGITADRYWIETGVSRTGRRSLAITVRPEDRDPNDPRIQRNEIWLRERFWDPMGEESWYGFSFRIAHDGAPIGDARWVIGQWKEDGDRSPFLAQRFNGGVFRVTVQDNDCQVTIASERGLDGSAATQGVAEEPSSVDVALGHGTRVPCATDIRVVPGETQGVLPSPADGWVDMVYRVRRAREGRGLVQVWANGRLVASAQGSIGNDGAGPRCYFKIGIYRDPIADVATLYVDNFRRGHSYAEVDPTAVARDL